MFPEEKYPLQDKTGKIIGLCMEIHKILGKGLLEIVYKDALEFEFKTNNIPYEREREYNIIYKDHQLLHKFFADFIVFDKIILEVKCARSIVEEHYSQVINYLAISKCLIGLVVNFGEESLKTKRIIL